MSQAAALDGAAALCLSRGSSEPERNHNIYIGPSLAPFQPQEFEATPASLCCGGLCVWVSGKLSGSPGGHLGWLKEGRERHTAGVGGIASRTVSG